MPQNTFTLIEKITVGAAGASSITFTSIPQTYTDLVVKVSARGTQSATYASYGIKFNGSTTGYYLRQLYGDGTSAVSSSATPTYIPLDAVGATATASTFSNNEIYIPNYTSSNNKSVSLDGVTENNATEAYTELYAGLWSNSAAITSIAIEMLSGTFVANSTFYLYGIAKEGVSPSPSSAPYATGGDSIVFDGTYWIHTFTSSGTFTPKKGLTCDYLVVAGGGGGGGTHGGGGGAGGLRSTVTATGGGGSLETALSLTSGTAYTVTVGAGGARGESLSAGSVGGNSVFSTITSTGGGGGGKYNSNTATSGGSGGGGSGGLPGAAGASASPSGQGYAGGTGGDSEGGGGGGGGAGATGSNGTATASGNGGNGGNGVATSITGSSVTYGGGGGGGTNGSTAGTGGTGGGGNGSSGSASGFNGTPGETNKGGGGGGGNGNTPTPGGAGGSGIVIIRYAA